MTRLLDLQRQIRDLQKEFAPPALPPDSAQALISDLWSTWILIVLFHSHGWQHRDGPEEIVRLLGIPESMEWNWNVPRIKDALCKLCFERMLMKSWILVEGRGGKRPNDEAAGFFNDDLQSLYSDIPVELKKRYGLPVGFLELHSRAEALFGPI